MARYIRKFKSTASLGPTEERGVVMWVGYDVPGVERDLTELGILKVDGWSEERLREHGVVAFTTVTPEQLGIRRDE